MSVETMAYSENPLVNLGDRFGCGSDTFLYFSAKSFVGYFETKKKEIIDSVISEHVNDDEIRNYGELFLAAISGEIQEMGKMSEKRISVEIAPDNEDTFYVIISGPDCELKRTLAEEYEKEIRAHYLMWSDENLTGFPKDVQDAVWEKYRTSF